MTDSSGAERMLDQLAAAWNAHDIDGVLACFVDDCVYEDVAFDIQVKGKDGIRTFAEMMFQTIPDFRYEPGARVVGDGMAAIEYTLYGTPERDLSGNPVEPYALSKRGVSFLELRGDKIVRNSDYVDSAGVKA
jgi:steroid delta-isomerase-like uncharacterized protein